MRVCIIGRSLTSLTLAKALVDHNIYVEILSNKKKLTIDKSRTIGITRTNIEYFNKNIINIEKIIWKLKKIEIFSEKLNKEQLLQFENNNKELFSMVKGYDLYQILDVSLQKNKFFKTRNQKNLIVSPEKYDLIINPDFSSSIAKKYFSKKLIKKYKSTAYTGILCHDKISNNVAIQIFTKIGPLAFLPISDTKTSVVYSIKNSKNIKISNLSTLIKSYNFKYKIKKIQNTSKFKLFSTNLRSYYHKNILAFGDITHKIHPLAGQGFNMTIRDIKILLSIIKNKIELGLPLDSSVNQEFEDKSKAKNLIFSNGVDLIYEFFNIEGKLENDLLSRSVQLLGKNSSINKIFTKLADKGSIL